VQLFCLWIDPIFSSTLVCYNPSTCQFLYKVWIFLFLAVCTNGKRRRFLAVFRIRDILVRILNRIRGSVPLTNGSGFASVGSGSSSFRQWPSRHQPRIMFSLFLLTTFQDTFTLYHSSKIKSQKRSHKTVEIKVFLTIVAWWWNGPDPYLWLTYPDPDPGGISCNPFCGPFLSSLILYMCEYLLTAGGSFEPVL
jgi:hypothetical protein